MATLADAQRLQKVPPALQSKLKPISSLWQCLNGGFPPFPVRHVWHLRRFWRNAHGSC